MKKLLLLFLAAAQLLPAQSIPPPREATASEVSAGTSASVFVSPRRLNVSVAAATASATATATAAASAASASATAASNSAGSAATSATTALNAIISTFKGGVAGASVAATSTAAGDYYRITSAGTSQSKTWAVGDLAVYNGTSGSWTQISGGVTDPASLAAKTNALSAEQGLVFNGSAGAPAAIPSSAAISTGAFSVSMTIEVPASAPSGDAGFFFLSDVNTSGLRPNGLIGYITSTGILSFSLYGATTSDYRLATVSGFRAAYAGKYVHLVFVRPASGNPVLYVNGASTALGLSSAGTAPSWQGSVNSAFIGIGSYATSALWTGAVLRPALFNYALDAAQVLARYEAGRNLASDYNNATNTSQISGDNSTFASAGNWTVTGSTTISGGKLNLVAGNQAYCTPGNINLPNGRRFRVTLTVDSITAGSVQVYTGSIGGWVTIASSPGTYTADFLYTAAGASPTLNLQTTGGNAVVDSVSYFNLGAIFAPELNAEGSGQVWYDLSGSNAHVTIPSSVSWAVRNLDSATRNTSGRNASASAQGLVFDGSGLVGANATLTSAIGTSDLTLILKCEVPATNPPAARGLLHLATARLNGTTNELEVVIDTSGNLIFLFRGATGGDGQRAWVPFVSSFAGQIVNVAFTRTGTTVGIRINGVAQTVQQSPFGTPPAWSASIPGTLLSVGILGQESPWIGYLAPVAIYNYLLSPAEQDAVFTTGRPAARDYNNATNSNINASGYCASFGASDANVLGLFNGAGGGSDDVGSVVAGQRTGGAGSWFGRLTSQASGLRASTLNASWSGFSSNRSWFMIRLWAKASTSLPVGIYLRNPTTAEFSSTVSIGSVTTSWAQYTALVQAPGGTITQVYASITHGGAGETFDVDDLEIIPLGALFAPEVNPPGNGYQWKDMSGNRADILLVTGVAWALPDRRPNSVRGSLTWAGGSHEAKSLLGQRCIPNDAVLESFTVKASAATTTGFRLIDSTDVVSHITSTALTTTRKRVNGPSFNNQNPAGTTDALCNLALDPDTANYTGTMQFELNYTLGPSP